MFTGIRNNRKTSRVPVIRRRVIMAGRCWLDASLDRSSKLGLEVLQRAKRRSESWKNVGSSHGDDSCTEKHTEDLEHPAAHMTLDNAFAKIMECMSETSNQCKRFYRSASAAELHEQERTHMCRFHAKQLLRTSRQIQTTTLTSKRAHYTALSEPEDFLIEVSPGTYAITAGMQDAGPQTRVVHISAGESMRLTFNL
ncbi:A-kinase-interacting protein 1 [Ictalurus furcatus]|uniref:A-kinase-interacting protein 1 n=1 Tax=Ictalurus furcatus TaxID=66913 RepID=UPI002350A22B|nr:A-kinase-interacting protein 1 [Ictalurus furcatus]